MTRFGHIKLLVGCLVLVGVNGCAPVRPSRYNSFLPPQTRPSQIVTAAPPVFAPSSDLEGSFARGVPVTQFGSRPSRVDQIVKEADWHYQLGRKHYQDGDAVSARREFDRAIDILLAAPDRGAAGERSPQGPVEKKLEELMEAIYRLDLAGLGAGDTGEPQYDRAALDDIPQMTFPVDPRLKNKVLEEVRATASQLPLQATDAVLSYINYFSTERGRRQLLFGLRRAGRYKKLIQRILNEEGVPEELIYIAQAESAFLPRAVSRKSAAGMWQFLASRGRQYGLNRTALVDERLDFEKATRAAARHLRDLYQRYGDWYLAMCAYNAGPGVVDRAVERTGYSDFWEFRRRNVLPRETANYVPIILAMTIMVKNAREYDLDNVAVDEPVEYDTVELSAPTSLALVADLAECPVPLLRELNPALLRDVAPPGTLRVPKGAAAQLAALENIPAERRSAWRVHRVADGDSLGAIARRYGVTERAIAAANGEMAGATLPAGALLMIPAREVQRAGARGVPRRGASSVRAAARRGHARHGQTAQASIAKTKASPKPALKQRAKADAQTARRAPGRVAVASAAKRGARTARR